MNVSLAPDIQKYLDEQVKSGRYASVDEAVNGLISLARAEDELSAQDLDELRADIELGIGEADAGEVGEWDPEDLKRRVREHLDSEKRAG